MSRGAVRWLAAALWIVLSGVASHESSAQIPTLGGGDDAFTLETRWGLEDTRALGAEIGLVAGPTVGTIPAERFIPVRFIVSSGDRAVGGYIQITYGQDSTQRVTQRVGFSTTPGRVAEFETIVALPRIDQQRITVVARDDRGRLLARRMYSQFAGTVGESRSMPAVISREGLSVLIVDEAVEVPPPIVVANRGNQQFATQRSAQGAFEATRFVNGKLTDLPRSWAGYDAFGAVMMTPRSFLDLEPSQSDALRRWIEMGGTLVLAAWGPGPDWRRVSFGPFAPERMISISETRTGEVSSRVSETVADRIGSTTRELGFGEGFDAVLTPYRAIRITPAARSIGWASLWDLRVQSEGINESGFLAVAGPAGLGRVVVLGVDPDAISRGVTVSGGSLGEGVVSAAFLTDLVRAEMDLWYAPNDQWSWYYRSSSGGDEREASALRAAADAVTRGLPIEASSFVIIVIGFGVLILLVGPIDMFVLKRAGLRHRSWAVAIGWVVVWSVGAAILPGLLRTTETTLGRFTAIDAYYPSSGSPPAVAARTGISTIMAGRTTRLDIGDPGAATVLRGVSSAQINIYSNARQTLPDLPMARVGMPTETGSAATVVIPVDREGARGGVPQRLWTLRGLMDKGPLDADARAALPLPRVERVADGYRVGIAGLPDAEELTAVMRVGGGWYALPAEGLRESAEPVIVEDENSTVLAPEQWSVIEDEDVEALPPFVRARGGQVGPLASVIARGLPGPNRRAETIRAYGDSERFAVVMVSMRRGGEAAVEPNAPPSAWDWFDLSRLGSGDPPSSAARVEVLRLVVPVEGIER